MTISSMTRFSANHNWGKNNKYSDTAPNPVSPSAVSNEETQALASVTPEMMLKAMRAHLKDKEYQAIINIGETVPTINRIRKNPAQIQSLENKNLLKMLRYYALALGEITIKQKKDETVDHLMAMFKGTQPIGSAVLQENLQTAINLLEFLQESAALKREKAKMALNKDEKAIYQETVKRFSNFYELAFHQKVSRAMNIHPTEQDDNDLEDRAFRAVG